MSNGCAFMVYPIAGTVVYSITQIKVMKAVILLATLKKEGQSNTQVLSAFFTDKLKTKNIAFEIIKLVDHNILPGTYTNMGEGDDWPAILDKLTKADIIIFATPVWWGSHSSEMQKVIERLDNIHDEILEGKSSRLEGKVGGIIVTGDSDGAEHIIGNISNFFNAIGIVFPPYSTLTVLAKKLEKKANTTREDLLALFEKDYAKTAETMVTQLVKYAAK